MGLSQAMRFYFPLTSNYNHYTLRPINSPSPAIYSLVLHFPLYPWHLWCPLCALWRLCKLSSKAPTSAIQLNNINAIQRNVVWFSVIPENYQKGDRLTQVIMILFRDIRWRWSVTISCSNHHPSLPLFWWKTLPLAKFLHDCVKRPICLDVVLH